MTKRPYRFVWETALRELEHLGRETKQVALMIATYADADGTHMHPGEDRLARDLGVTTRTVRRHLATLRDLGLINRTREGSSYGRAKKSDEYALEMPGDIEARVQAHNENLARIREEHRTQVTGDNGADNPISEPGTPEADDQNTGHPATETPDTGVRPPPPTTPDHPSITSQPHLQTAREDPHPMDGSEVKDEGHDEPPSSEHRVDGQEQNTPAVVRPHPLEPHLPTLDSYGRCTTCGRPKRHAHHDTERRTA